MFAQTLTMGLKIHAPLPQRKDFRIGVLGSGFIVNDCHLVAYRKAGFNPVAIASRNASHAAEVAKRHAIPKAYATYDELLEDPTIEVLDIGVPPNAQLALIKAACARKTAKGILAQKPLGMNYAEAIEAVAACGEAGITLAVNQNMRCDQSVRAAKTLLENGTIGEPVFATIEMRAIPHWMDWHRDLGWLTLRIMSIHHLDTFRYWFGDPESIYCSVRTDPRTSFPHSDGICTYILEYKTGLRCIGIDDTWTGPAKEGCPADNYIRWRIEGLNGLALGDVGWCKDPYTTPSTIRYVAKGDKDFQCPKWSESWFPDAFIGTMAQLLVALENGREPEISGKDNLKTMALVEAAYESAAKSRPVSPVHLQHRVSTARVASPDSRLLPGHTQKNAMPSRSPGSRTIVAKRPGFLAKLSSKIRLGRKGDRTSVLPPVSSNRFTVKAEHVLTVARKEAEQLNHQFVGTEHLLLGLTHEHAGLTSKVLRNAGIDREKLLEHILRYVSIGPERNPLSGIPQTPRVKKVLAKAVKECKALKDVNVTPEHILLGLLKENEGVAAKVLKALKVNQDEMRRDVLKELGRDFN